LPNINQIVSGLRKSISDTKQGYINVVDEPIAIASGVNPELFYTLNMPVLSGNTVDLKIGRWQYTEYSTETACSGFRGYTFSQISGGFLIPTGGIEATSGDTVYATYTYTKNKSYEYQDSELFEYVRDGLEFVQSYRGFGLIGAGVGTGYSISPTPTNLQAFLITLASKYVIQKDREQLGLIDGIMIREADLTIDTTRSAKARLDSSENIRKVLLDILYKANLDDTAAAGEIIDTYSTFVTTDTVGLSYEKNEEDGPHGLGAGNE